MRRATPGAGGRGPWGLSDRNGRPLGQAVRASSPRARRRGRRGGQSRGPRGFHPARCSQQLRTDVLPRGLPGCVSGPLGRFLRGRERAARAPSPPGKGLASTWPMRSVAAGADGPEGPRGSGPRLCARPAAGGAFFPPPRAPCKRGASGSLPAAGGEPAPESLGCFFKLSVQPSNRASKPGKVWTFGKGRVALGRGTAWAKASRWAGCRATKGGEARWEGPGLCILSARGWVEARRGTPLQQGGLLEKF